MGNLVKTHHQTSLAKMNFLSLTTILNLVPLCFTMIAIGGNGPPYYPMARAMVRGLAFSTLVTLIILPTVYVLMDDWRRWGQRVVKTAKSIKS